MAHGRMDIDRLDRIAAGRVDDVIGLGKLDQLAEILLVAGAAPAFAIGHEGCRSDLRKDQIVPPISTLRSGFLACIVKAGGTDAIMSMIRPRSKRTRRCRA